MSQSARVIPGTVPGTTYPAGTVIVLSVTVLYSFEVTGHTAA